MIDKIIQILHAWGRLTRAVESILIDNIAATSPWLAPLLPAFMAHQAMSTHLGFPAWVSICGAVVVEFLGLASITTTFQFWDYNDSRRKLDQAAPVRFAGMAAGFYLIVVITVNVMLDPSPWLHRIAKALLSSLSVIAAIILALRAQHSRRLDGIQQERQDRKEARKLSRKIQEPSGNFPEGSDWRKLPEEDRRMIHDLSTAEIAARYQVSERTARNWRSRKNGHLTGL